MKAAQIRQKNTEELLKLLTDSYEQLRDFRFQASIRKLKNVKQINAVKKDVARILTILIERNNQNEQPSN
ncbi:MAG: 50S ribosomal protein L29 [Patescibacteria group bacterium]